MSEGETRLAPRPVRAERYAQLTTGEIIRTALSRAVFKECTTLVIGPSGVGKTSAIAEIEADAFAVAAVITPAHHNVAGIYRLLLEVYEVSEPGRMTLHELERKVYGELPRLCHGELDPLILDEYQGLPATTLRELLKVQEALRFALVLVGNGETLAERKQDQLIALEQIRNRIRSTYRIPGLVDEDFDRIADEWLVEKEAATRRLIAGYGRRFSLHQLGDLLATAREIARIGPTRLEHIRAAVALDNPDRLALFKMSPSPTPRKRAANDK